MEKYFSEENLDCRRASAGKISFKDVAKMMVMESQNSGKTEHVEPMHAALSADIDETQNAGRSEEKLIRNRAMLNYIAHLATSNSETDTFSYSFVQSLLDGGASLNEAVDVYGQTIFHEVARSWNLDVAMFLLNNGANINQQDKYGRSPLHVCAASDHYDMVEFLLQNGADIDSKSEGDGQTPLHFAAKNNATRSLQALLGFGANIDSLDTKRRTALQVASELSRTEAVRILIEEGASSCLYDVNGSSAMTVLIDKLPHLAVDALDQLHVSDGISRCNKFYLNLLEESRQGKTTKEARTALETAVNNRQFSVLMHPVMQRLVDVKWQHYGRFGTMTDFFINLVYAILFTVFAVNTPGEGKDLYFPMKRNAWRLFVGTIIIIVTTYQMYLQIQTTYKSRKQQMLWIKWRLGQLKSDLQFCHPKWQEEKYIRDEMKVIKNLPLLSSIDTWFFFDWFIIILILVTIALNFSYFFIGSSGIKSAYLRILSALVILVWMRILKYLRPFPGIGTLVLIVGATGGDFVNWGFFFMLLFIPFTSCFWVIFGGSSYNKVSGFTKVPRLIYTLFQMSVGEDFNIDGLIKADNVMARLLSALYITCMVVICLNILIAYLSNTFTTVYSKAVENTNMQRAINILNIENFLPKKRLKRFYDHLRHNANPDIVPWSPVIVADKRVETKVAAEIENSLNKTREVLAERFNRRVGKGKLSTFDMLLIDVQKIKSQQMGTVDNLVKIQTLLDDIGSTLGIKTTTTVSFSNIISRMVKDQREHSTSVLNVREQKFQSADSNFSKKKVRKGVKMNVSNFDNESEYLEDNESEEHDNELLENEQTDKMKKNKQKRNRSLTKFANRKDIKEEMDEEEFEEGKEEEGKEEDKDDSEKENELQGNKKYSKTKENERKGKGALSKLRNIKSAKPHRLNKEDREFGEEEERKNKDDSEDSEVPGNKKYSKTREHKPKGKGMLSKLRKSRSSNLKDISEDDEEDEEVGEEQEEQETEDDLEEHKKIQGNKNYSKAGEIKQKRKGMFSKLKKSKSANQSDLNEEEEETENYDIDELDDYDDEENSRRKNEKNRKGNAAKMTTRRVPKNKNKISFGKNVHIDADQDHKHKSQSRAYQEQNRFNQPIHKKPKSNKQSRSRSQADRSDHSSSLSLVSYRSPTINGEPSDFAEEFLNQGLDGQENWEQISIDSVSL